MLGVTLFCTYEALTIDLCYLVKYSCTQQLQRHKNGFTIIISSTKHVLAMTHATATLVHVFVSSYNFIFMCWGHG